MKIALGIQYDGINYNGWQKQLSSNTLTVQGILEDAIAKVANHCITTFCAGRTDAKVHASFQVIHFETFSARKITAWIYGVNRYLPSNIRVIWAKEVPDEFHARFLAFKRQYKYLIHNSDIPNAILQGKITPFSKKLDINLMQEGANFLLGENDFSSFRAANCQSLSPFRNLSYINIQRYNSTIIITIEANAFLYHMVRNIVGSLLEVGIKKHPPQWIQWLLEQKDRSLAAPTAKPDGLYLTNVEYPEEFQIPKPSNFSLII